MRVCAVRHHHGSYLRCEGCGPRCPGSVSLCCSLAHPKQVCISLAHPKQVCICCSLAHPKQVCMRCSMPNPTKLCTFDVQAHFHVPAPRRITALSVLLERVSSAAAKPTPHKRRSSTPPALPDLEELGNAQMGKDIHPSTTMARRKLSMRKNWARARVWRQAASQPATREPLPQTTEPKTWLTRNAQCTCTTMLKTTYTIIRSSSRKSCGSCPRMMSNCTLTQLPSETSIARFGVEACG
jgi:hypothetical protein